MLMKMKSCKTEINYQSALKRFDKVLMNSTGNVELNAINYFESLTFSSQKMLIAALKNENRSTTFLNNELKDLMKKPQFLITRPAMNVEQIKKLRDAAYEMGLKHQAIIITMINTLCRKFEVNEIWNNYSGESTCLISGKGNKLAKIYIDEELKKVLDKWVNDSDFKNYSEKHLDTLTKEVFERAGIKGSAHDIRRSVATLLRNHNMPLEQISLILRHSDLNTTLKYIKISDNDIFYGLKNKYLDVNEFVNEHNFREVVLELLIKNQEQAKKIKELEEQLNEK